MFQHQLDGVIQVFGLEHEDPAQLLLRLGIWAIGDRHFDILPLQGGGVLSALERFPNHQSNLSLEARRRRQNTHPSWHSARFRIWFPIFSNPCIQGRCISQVPPVGWCNNSWIVLSAYSRSAEVKIDKRDSKCMRRFPHK